MWFQRKCSDGSTYPKNSKHEVTVVTLSSPCYATTFTPIKPAGDIKISHRAMISTDYATLGDAVYNTDNYAESTWDFPDSFDTASSTYGVNGAPPDGVSFCGPRTYQVRVSPNELSDELVANVHDHHRVVRLYEDGVVPRHMRFQSTENADKGTNVVTVKWTLDLWPDVVFDEHSFNLIVESCAI